jgi:hypothetical protein
MPLTPPGIIGVMLPALFSAGNIGTGTPKLASGIAAGVMLWVAQMKVTTIDTGSLGVGVGLLPCAVPQPLLFAGVGAGMVSFGNVGPMAPLLTLGVANGLALAFLQGLITTTHPSVGTGSGVAKFVGPSAISSMVGGFASLGMVSPGAVKIASSIGMGIDIAFAGFIVPIPIVGSASPVASGGTGTGTIV